jgi:hypothetical protein
MLIAADEKIRSVGADAGLSGATAAKIHTVLIEVREAVGLGGQTLTGEGELLWNTAGSLRKSSSYGD